MPSPLMSLVTRTVAASPLAEDCVFVVGAVACATRATWVRREEADGDWSAVKLASSIRVPAEDLAGDPLAGDEVRIDGRVLYATYAHRRGPVVEIGLTARRPR